MATLRIPESVWKETYEYLYGTPGEHFAFFLANWSEANKEPVFLVSKVMLVPENLTSANWTSYGVEISAILPIINEAIKGNYCLIEIHNHGGNLPRWSYVDKAGLDEFVEYIHSSLPNRPYAATVWGSDTIFGEYFLSTGHRGLIRSITVVGDRFSQLVSRDDDLKSNSNIFDRQKIWFSEHGQRQLARIRVAVVGCGGTGSHVLQQLAYLGCRDFVIIDDDLVDASNLNRLVTATHADIGKSKVVLGNELIKKIAPNATVIPINNNIQSLEALDVLKGVDVIFGCVDNDGARLVINELALAYCIPYFDLAAGIIADSNEKINDIGGRVLVVLPGGPCLYCMNEIDISEASFYLASDQEKTERIQRGYVTGVDVPAPAVVSLNGLVASVAVNEFAIYVSGLRKVNVFSSIDVLGIGRATKGQWVTPQLAKGSADCLQCALTGVGDRSNIMRYKQKL